jgi:arsenate reductase
MKNNLKLAALFLGVLLISSFKNHSKLSKKLTHYSKGVISEFALISDERKKDLKEIGDYIVEQRSANKTCKLLFICTSNSRRSHMGQIWASTASRYFGVDSVVAFSGGTEATKVNINAIKALKRCGFGASSAGNSENPVWTIVNGIAGAEQLIYSKKYDDIQNPKKDFVALMVCSEADKSCPIVDGADLRVALPYEDPKHFDNTPSQDLKYDERCREIAREMYFMFDYVKQKLIVKTESKK